MPRKQNKKKNQGGRPRKYDLATVEKLFQPGEYPDNLIAKHFGVSMRTVARWWKIPEFQTAVRIGKSAGKLQLRRLKWKLSETSPRMAIHLGKKYLGQK